MKPPYLLTSMIPFGDSINGDLMDDKGNLSNNSSLGTAVDNLSKFAGAGTLNIMDWGVKVITILFVLGVILMIAALMFKNGQWQKSAQGLMLFSFVALLMIRGIAIIVLSFRSGMDVEEALNGGLNILIYAGIYLGIIGALISFIFKLAYVLIEHPEYRRWSKNVFNISIVMMVFAMIGPYLFKIM